MSNFCLMPFHHLSNASIIFHLFLMQETKRFPIHELSAAHINQQALPPARKRKRIKNPRDSMGKARILKKVGVDGFEPTTLCL